MTMTEWARLVIEPSRENLETQLKVFAEEHQEYWDARDNLDRMDAICDQRQVIECVKAADPSFDTGALEHDVDVCLSHFITQNGDLGALRQYCDAVVKSNYSKFCDNAKDAHESLMRYANIGLFCICTNIDGYFVISAFESREIDGKLYTKGKILKGINYKEPREFL